MDEIKKIATLPVTRTSLITGVTHTLELPIIQEQLDRYEAGDILLQDAFPDLPKGDREFIKTGITAQEWERHVVGGDDIAEAAEPEFGDNEIVLLAITPETFGVAIDLLSHNDAMLDPSFDDESSPAPGKGSDLDVDIS